MSIRFKLILAPVVVLTLFTTMLLTLRHNTAEMAQLTAAARGFEQQAHHVQALLRGLNESRTSGGSVASTRLVKESLARFSKGYQALIRQRFDRLQFRTLVAEVGPTWLSFRDQVFTYIQDRDASPVAREQTYQEALKEGDYLHKTVRLLAVRSQSSASIAARETNLSATLLAILVMAGLLVLFSQLYRTVARPISALRQTMQGVAGSDDRLTERIQEGLALMPAAGRRHDEVAALGDAFRFMLDTILVYMDRRRHAEEALKDMNLTLEDQVDARTRELHGANASLEQAKGEMESILDSAGEGIVGLDSDGRIMFVNAAVEHISGWASVELGGKPFLSSLYARSAPGHEDDEDLLGKALMGGTTRRSEGGLFRRRGETAIPVAYTTTPIRKQGRSHGSVIIFADISERRHMEEELRLAASVFHDSADGVLVTDPDWQVVRINGACSHITGYGAADLVGQPVDMLRSDRHDDAFFENIQRSVKETGTWQGEVWNQRNSGQVFAQWQTVSAVTDDAGEVIRYIFVFSDITDKKLSEERIYRLAHFDSLTGLPNRALYHDRLQHAIAHARRRFSRLALLFIDLDRFKLVNDSSGHPMGDQLLLVISQRLQSMIRETDTVARLGGDEFSVILSNPGGQAQIQRLVDKLLTGIAEPMTLERREIHITASIGISLFPSDGEDKDALIKNADTAMYRAKDEGRNTSRFFSEDMSSAATERADLENQLRRAVSRGELSLNFQPQVDSYSGEVAGLEALLRWSHPDLGRVSPEKFIGIAEETGLIIEIGEWALREACQQYMEWSAENAAPSRMSVNLSARQFQHEGLFEMVMTVVRETGMDPRYLELELTESALMNDPDRSIAVLQRLRAEGIRISIDDFGVAYSSLSQLQKFPVDELKVDRSFITNIHQSPDDAAITAAIIAMGQSLNLKIVAEGVEEQAQMDFLSRHGCYIIQGYYFSRPLDGPQTFDMLRQNAAFRRDVLTVDGDSGDGASISL